MASIKEPITGLLTKLREIEELKYVRVFNNQIKWAREGKIEAFPSPCAFIEVVSPAQYNQIGVGFLQSDLNIRIHLHHEYYDAQDGTMEQDLAIFDLRDKVLAKLSGYKPTACTPMVMTSESQDYEHDNIYSYQMEFLIGFIESKGSSYDPAAGVFVDSTPPATLEVSGEYDNSIPVNLNNTNQKPFIIPQ